MQQTVRVLSWMVCLSLGCVSCALFHPDAADRTYDVNRRLASYVRAWETAREGEVGARDAEEARTQVEGLLGSSMRTEEIRQKIQHLAFENPRHVPTLMANGAISFESGDLPGASQYLDRVLSIQPGHTGAAILRSRVALREGNLPRARTLLENQIQIAPDHAELRAAYAGVLYLAGDLDEARGALEAARRLGATEWRIAYNRGLVEEAAEHLDEARRQYSICTELNPDFRPAAARLAGLQVR